MQYKDKRGWLFEVRQGADSTEYSTYCYNPQKKKWSAWPCANWHGSKTDAEREMQRYAKKRGWVRMVPGTNMPYQEAVQYAKKRGFNVIDEDNSPSEPLPRLEELREAAQPLVEFIRKHYNPYTTAIVDCGHVEVLSGEIVVKYDDDWD